jgi:transcriptional regulator with XRE-family HTH domain
MQIFSQDISLHSANLQCVKIPLMENIIQVQETIISRLKQKQDEMGIADDKDFAKVCGISAPFMSQIYSGARIGIRSLKKIAANLKVTEAYLTGNQVLINIIAEVSAGESFQCFFDGQSIDIIDISQLPLINTKKATDYYGLKVSGTSMYPMQKNGDILIAERNSFYKVTDGDKIVYEDIDGYCWVKYIEFAGNDMLNIRSLNLSYPSITIKKETIKLIDKIIYIIPA